MLVCFNCAASNSVGLTSFMQPSTFPSYPPQVGFLVSPFFFLKKKKQVEKSRGYGLDAAQGSQASVPGISQKHVPSSMRHDNTLRQVNGDSGAFQGLSAPSLSGKTAPCAHSLSFSHSLSLYMFAFEPPMNR